MKSLRGAPFMNVFTFLETTVNGDELTCTQTQPKMKRKALHLNQQLNNLCQRLRAREKSGATETKISRGSSAKSRHLVGGQNIQPLSMAMP